MQVRPFSIVPFTRNDPNLAKKRVKLRLTMTSRRKTVLFLTAFFRTLKSLEMLEMRGLDS